MAKIASMFLVFFCLTGCSTAHLYNVEGFLLPLNQSQKDTRRLVTKALERKGWKWDIEPTGTVITASILVRERHYAAIKIKFDSHKLSIIHLESKNLNFDEQSQTIHKNYNKWIKLLEKELLLYFSERKEADSRSLNNYSQ